MHGKDMSAAIDVEDKALILFFGFRPSSFVKTNPRLIPLFS